MVEDRSRTLVFSFLMYPDCSCHGLVQNKYHYSLRRARRAILVKTEVGNISLYSLQIRIFQIKTKCILFCGRVNSVEYPVPVLLDGKELSWVQPDPGPGGYHGPGDKIRRAEFINRTVEIREQLSFAYSSQVLKDQVYSFGCLWFYVVVL